MNSIQKLLSTTAILVTSCQVMAIPFEPTFSDYSFPGSQYTVDAAANAFFGTNYGINIDNAYLYKDTRDTFDGVGISVGPAPNTSVPEVGRITFLDSTDFVEIDYWGIRPTTYSVFGSSSNLLETFSIGSDTLGTYLFNTGDIISYLTWASDGGFGQISGMRYDYDGTTDGRNDDISVPEPSLLALLVIGLAGIGFSRKRINL